MKSFPAFALPCFRLLLPLLVLVGMANTHLRAQYFTESFDDVSALWTNGWAQQNRSVPIGGTPDWFQGDPGIFAAYDGGDTAYIGVNYNCVAGSNTISNWLFTPTCTFSNGEKITFWTRTVDDPNYPDRMQMRLSLNGASTNVGTTAASVGDFTTLLLQINPTLTASGYPNAWTKYTVIISGLAAPTAGRAAFRYFVGSGGPGGINSEYIGIDSVAYFLPPAGDLEMLAIHPMEYTVFPERHPFAGPFTGTLENYGSTAISNATMEVHIYDDQGMQVFTSSSTPVAAMVPGDRDTVTALAPTALAPGDYTMTYIARHSGADGDHANDTLHDRFSIAPLTYARDNGNVVGDIGIGGAYDRGHVGQQFHFNQADNLDSIWVHVTQGYAGKRIAAVVWDMAAGLPNAVVGSTDTLTYTTDAAADYVLPLHGGHLQLPAGDFVVTLVEFDSTLHVGLADEVFTPGKVWLYVPGIPTGRWKNVEAFGLAQYIHPLMVRAILSACDMTIATTATPESSPGANDASATVVATGGTPPYTYLWSTGATTTAINGLGTNPVAVTVTDAAGCTSEATVSLLVGLEEDAISLACTAYPNPNDGRFKVHIAATAPTAIALSVMDMHGRVVYETQAAATPEFITDVDLRDRAAGIYCVRLQVGDTCRVVKVVVRR